MSEQSNPSVAELRALLAMIHAVLPRECWFLRERIARALAPKGE